MTSWRDRFAPVRVGDEVAYSKQFLKSIACYTGDMPRAKGKIAALKELSPEVTLATIEWDRDGLPERVNVRNLVKVSSPAYGMEL